MILKNINNNIGTYIVIINKITFIKTSMKSRY